MKIQLVNTDTIDANNNNNNNILCSHFFYIRTSPPAATLFTIVVRGFVIQYVAGPVSLSTYELSKI